MIFREIQLALYIIYAGNIIALTISHHASDVTEPLPLYVQDSSTRPVYNMTNLIYEYYLVCGPQYICNKHHYSFVYEFKSTPRVKVCPQCRCDRQCVLRQDCCPDVILSMPEQDCVTTSLLQGRVNKKSNHYIFADCHEKSPEELKDKCMMNYTDTESLQYPPVTSRRYAFTFRNKFCAECNGIHNYTEWNIDVSCFDFVDLNFLSSYEAIYNTARSNDCKLEYVADEGNMHKCFGRTQHSTDYEPLESWCNVTGTWAYRDPDIEAACAADYLPRYKTYRNIFCFICNPPDYLHEDEIVATCNVSGIWSPYEAAIEHNCNSMDWTPSTQPYKNVFCFLCNRNNTNYNRYFDVSISTTESESLYENFFTVTRYNLDFYHVLLEKSKTMMFLSHIHKPMPLFSNQWNTTKLVSYHYAVEGSGSFCKIPHQLFQLDLCSCDMKTCLYSHKPPFCCLDVLLEAPTSCFSDILVESSSVNQKYATPYSAISKCEQSNVGGAIDESQLRCGIAADDIFGTLPVTHGQAIYKNFDCMWCHLNSKEKQHIQITPWDVQIKCPYEINAEFHVLLNDVIKTAKVMDCSVRVFPRHRNSLMSQVSRMHCTKTSEFRYVDKCNTTGHWMLFDPDVKAACENEGKFLPPYHEQYKNIFCYVCNPPTSSNISIDTCSVQPENQRYGEVVIELCRNSPLVPGYEPYKNVFCSLCSNINMTLPPPFPWNPRFAGGFDFPPTLSPNIHLVRGIFSADHEPQMTVKSEIQILTFRNDEEIYNTINNKTRRLMCYPGKVLTNMTCKPLLTKTNNLRYTLAFTLEANLSAPMKSSDILEPVMREVKGQITKQIRGISFESFHIMTNLKCDDPISNANGGLTFMVHTMFLIWKYVDRLSTEKTLLKFTNGTFLFQNVLWKSTVSSEAFMLPALVNTVGFMNHCYSKTVKGTTFNLHDNHKPVLVSQLLLCPQVELEEDEFEVDESHFEISVMKSDRKLHQEEFLLIDKKVRVCLKDFEEMFNGSIVSSLSQSPLYEPLKITTLVCNIISLICLFLTFITYCLFPAMRSLPGMNNMSLVFAMFFAQLLFQCGFYSSSSPTMCAVLGVFIHIFWLSTFGCMSVCSYHMYSVFAGDTIAGRLSALGWKKKMLLYIAYSYGLSSVIVICNIVIIYLTSDDDNIGYGKTRCFIENKTSFYLSFLSPVLIVCFTNIYFFIRTALQIKKSPKVDSTKERKNQHLIYVKLFSLTGITWILLVIDTLFPITVFSFLVTIATVLQGLFVLVSFVLNKRVYNYYKVLICGKRRKTTTSSSSQPGNTQSTNANSSSM
ncbi:uncharacterized protein [Argopecten irradians]|uniref:uncharacterized protein n=1 Tax=Argopecten irradians TaxID=31199 RepID=UPI003722C6FC